MFGKGKKQKTPQTSSILSRITNRSKEYALNDYETSFFIAFEAAAAESGLRANIFSAERMGSGSIRLQCIGGIIGTVHLRKRFGSIQYFISDLNVHEMTDAPIEAVIAVVPYWVSYAKSVLASYKAATTV